MIIVDDIYVSDDLYLVQFQCHLDRCKGACCVDGDAGAPLDEEEITILEDELDIIKTYMTERGIKVVDEQGVFDYDQRGHFVTPLVNDGECAYANFQDGIAFCAIEKAYFDGKISFRKPMSCHLYPVRITNYETFEAVNFHKWTICKPALKLGKNKGIPLYSFLKEALIRKYGKEWYQKLEKEIHSRLKEK